MIELTVFFKLKTALNALRTKYRIVYVSASFSKSGSVSVCFLLSLSSVDLFVTLVSLLDFHPASCILSRGFSIVNHELHLTLSNAFEFDLSEIE